VAASNRAISEEMSDAYKLTHKESHIWAEAKAPAADASCEPSAAGPWLSRKASVA